MHNRIQDGEHNRQDNDALNGFAFDEASAARRWQIRGHAVHEFLGLEMAFFAAEDSYAGDELTVVAKWPVAALTAPFRHFERMIHAFVHFSRSLNV